MTQEVADDWYRITDYVPHSESVRRAAGRFVSLFPSVGLARSVASLPVRDMSGMMYSELPTEEHRMFEDCARKLEARNLRVGKALCRS